MRQAADDLRAAVGEQRGQLVRAERGAVAGAGDRRGRHGAAAAARRERRVVRADRLQHARRLPLGVDELRIHAQALVQRHAVLREARAHLRRRRERVLR
jgi:hypothetical protein